MEIYFKKTAYGPVPLYDSDKSEYDKIKMGDEFKAVITKPRNYEFHKKGMALINLAFANQNQFTEFNPFRYWLTMKAGFVDVFTTSDGTMFLPQSISYAKMDDLEFQDFYSKLLDVVLKVTGNTSEEIEKEILKFM